MHLLLINNSEKLFIPKPGWKIKYTKILWKKIKWHIKSKEIFVYLWEKNIWKTTLRDSGRKVQQPIKVFGSSWSRFLQIKGFIGNNDITLIHKNKIISDEKQLTKQSNSYYINIVKSNGTKPKTFGTNFENTSIQSVRDIVNSYKNHPSIIKYKQVVNGSAVSDSKRFSFKTINEKEIKYHLKNLDIKKASGIDTIPTKLVKLSANFLTPLLTNAIKKSIG